MRRQSGQVSGCLELGSALNPCVQVGLQTFSSVLCAHLICAPKRNHTGCYHMHDASRSGTAASIPNRSKGRTATSYASACRQEALSGEIIRTPYSCTHRNEPNDHISLNNSVELKCPQHFRAVVALCLAVTQIQAGEPSTPPFLLWC